MFSIFNSLKRASPRIFLLLLIGAFLVFLSSAVPLLLGPTMAPLIFGFGLCFLGLAAGDTALRVLQPEVDAQDCAKKALKENSMGAGLVYLGRSIIAAAILLLVVTSPRAQTPPSAALPHLHTLKSEQQKWWPDMPVVSALGGQVEQETCPSLKHRQCWNPRAELRTSRERGVGLGQITKTPRFDSLTELRTVYPAALKDWSWETSELYDPRLQLRGLILMDLRNWKSLAAVPDPKERLAMTFASYNGGLGGLSSDRRACAGTRGCDINKWWGNVEHTSLKAKTAVKGYGKSFFEINREYPVNVMHVRRARYTCLDT